MKGENRKEREEEEERGDIWRRNGRWKTGRKRGGWMQEARRDTEAGEEEDTEH